jgi:hypothetical protein
MNFIKICPEIALKYFFEKNVVLYEIYSKKSKFDVRKQKLSLNHKKIKAI